MKDYNMEPIEDVLAEAIEMLRAVRKRLEYHADDVPDDKIEHSMYQGKDRR